MQLILASQSEGRKYLLKLLKIPFEIIHTNLDEEKIVGKNPVETVNLRAKLKGEDVANKISTRRYTLDAKPYLILSADTEVIFNNQLLGKPKDYKDAVRMLKMLSGKTHEVVSAFYLIRLISPISQIGEVYHGFDRSFVTFSDITDEEIKTYLSLTEYNKYTAGYAVVASPHTFIKKIEGSLSNVVGLPLEKVIPILRANSKITYPFWIRHKGAQSK